MVPYVFSLSLSFDLAFLRFDLFFVCVLTSNKGENDQMPPRNYVLRNHKGIFHVCVVRSTDFRAKYGFMNLGV